MIINCRLQAFYRDKSKSIIRFNGIDFDWQRVSDFEEYPDLYEVKKELWIVWIDEEGTEQRLHSVDVPPNKNVRIYYTNIVYEYRFASEEIISLTTRHNI